MESLIDKFVITNPYNEGKYRRRIASGFLFSFIIWFLLSIGNFQDASLLFKIKNCLFANLLSKGHLLKSPVFAMGILFVLYTIGNIIEMIGELFIIRAVGDAYYALKEPLRYKWLSKFPKFIRYIIMIPLYYWWVPLLFYYNFIIGFFGQNRFKLDLETTKNSSVKEAFEKLPEGIQEGLNEPIGNRSDLSWQYIYNGFDKENRQWLVNTRNRNKNILCFLTVITIAVIIIAIYMVYLSFNPLQTTTSPDNNIEILTNPFSYIITLITLILAFMFYGYFQNVKNTVNNLLIMINLNKNFPLN